MHQPNLPCSELSVLSITLQPSSRSATSNASRSATRKLIMKLAVPGSRYVVSRLNALQIVMPFSLPGPPHSKIAPPHSATSRPRWSRYHAASALGSFALKKMPPMPVTRFMVSPQPALRARSTAASQPPAAPIVTTNGQGASITGASMAPSPMPPGTRITSRLRRTVRESDSALARISCSARSRASSCSAARNRSSCAIFLPSAPDSTGFLPTTTSERQFGSADQVPASSARKMKYTAPRMHRPAHR